MNNGVRNMAKLRAAILIFFVTVLLAGAACAETYAVVYGTDTLNLRAQASSASQWLGTYAKGSWVTVIGSQNNFYNVTTGDGKAGYMSKNYLHTTDQLTYGSVAIVNNSKATAFLNLRSYPSYSASVIRILYNGVPLNILSEANGWYFVQLGSTQGYVRSEYTIRSNQPLGSNVATIQTPNNTAVNMRVAPSTSAAVRRQFSGDRYVAVLYQGTGWWYVWIDGYTGFISSDFLTEGLHAERDEAAQGDDGDGYAVVNNPISTQKLNLRELPSTASAVVSQLSNGYKLSVIVQGTQWCKVYADTLAAVGYVQTQYLKLYRLPSTPTLTIRNPHGSYVNLRASASMTAGILTHIPNQAKATVIAPGPDWSKVKYQGQTGYVMNFFTSIATAD